MQDQTFDPSLVGVYCHISNIFADVTLEWVENPRNCLYIDLSCQQGSGVSVYGRIQKFRWQGQAEEQRAGMEMSKRGDKGI